MLKGLDKNPRRRKIVLDDTDHPREACGVFGVYGPGEDVARLTFYGLYALQHRGQESAGIATSDGNKFSLHTDMGLVSQVFDEDNLSALQGHIAIGHTRYSTTGGSDPCNAQPVLVQDSRTNDTIALAHNGNITNAATLREDLLDQGITLQGNADTELVAHLLAQAPGESWEDRFKYLMRRLRGAYSLVIIVQDKLFALRDPMGVRPLSIGRLGNGWVAASETCALQHLHATEEEREVEPGEVIQIDDSGLHSFRGAPRNIRKAACTLEYVYFSRPDSHLRGELLYRARERMGMQLAQEHPTEADLVIGVPDSALPAAIGYAQESGIPYREGLVKNRYVGRTFIQPDQRIREAGVGLKFNALKEVLEGQRIVVVDDSIVRGTTKPRVVELLKRAGAKEIHVRIASPIITSPCFLGVDMATKTELIGANLSLEEIKEHIGADSLGYLSLDGLNNAINTGKDTLCNACFTGKYPLDVQERLPLAIAEL